MKKYRTIVVDPPWRYQQRAHIQTPWLSDRKHRGIGASAGDVYCTMTNTKIAELPIGELADPHGAHLYLWVTNTKLFEGAPSPISIVEGWGFTYKTLLTWNKTGPLGMGYYFRGRTEHVMFAIRGACPIAPKAREQNIFHAPNGSHSAKPDAFYDLVERVSPEPRLELFSRRARLGGWDYWGDESLQTVDLEGAA